MRRACFLAVPFLALISCKPKKSPETTSKPPAGAAASEQKAAGDVKGRMDEIAAWEFVDGYVQLGVKGGDADVKTVYFSNRPMQRCAEHPGYPTPDDPFAYIAFVTKTDLTKGAKIVAKGPYGVSSDGGGHFFYNFYSPKIEFDVSGMVGQAEAEVLNVSDKGIEFKLTVGQDGATVTLNGTATLPLCK